MIATVYLMLSGLMYSLQLSTGSFPKPLTAQEERYYLEKAAQGDLDARNILIERNLRLVAHIMKNGYSKKIPSAGKYLVKTGNIYQKTIDFSWRTLYNWFMLLMCAFVRVKETPPVSGE